MKKQNHIITILTAVVLVLSASTVKAYKKTSMDILVDGVKRNMIVCTPDVVTDNMPLMITTHGMNQSPEYQMDADRMWSIIDREKFIIAYLRSSGNMWDTGGSSDQRFVEQAIGEMYAMYKIDAHRVYWSGFSMGSMLMYHCMHNMTRKIAAFAPCSGIQFSEQPWTRVKGPINLIHCHAKDDSVFPLRQYDVHSYVENMAAVNGENQYTKKSNYIPFSGATPGDREVWENAEGYKVVLFMYNYGDHNPSYNNAVELWNFCKNIRLESIDAIREPEKAKVYTIDPESETTQNPTTRFSGQILLPTDVDGKAIFYGESSSQNPQNIMCGSVNEIGNHEYCWIKFTRINDAQTSMSGPFYTIQIVNKDGSPYVCWTGEGYLNTPPGTWCLFALGLNNQYGQDARNYGLWRLELDDEGYTLQNVGACEAGENSWISPAYNVPQKEKQHIRFFKKVMEVKASGIEDIAAPATKAKVQMYDIMGQSITSPRPGTIYIVNGKKYIAR